MIEEVVRLTQQQALLHPDGRVLFDVPQGYVVARCESCVGCGMSSLVLVKPDELARYRDGMHVQFVWPQASDDWRELLITGIHVKCWNEIVAAAERREEDGDV
jgi:hypothetical protein